MSHIFSTILSNSIWGSVLILVILALRLVLWKAPPRILCMLWILAALCLLLPARPQTNVSLQPSTQTVQHTLEAVVSSQPVQTDIPSQAPPPESRNYVPYIWAAGAGILALYTFISYWGMKIKLRTAVTDSDGVRISNRIRSAFVLGYLRPRIYLPQNLNESERTFIVAHERAHIRRADHWWKLLGFVCVCIHWFNPVVWLGYFIMCRDIETACDENVIYNMSLEERKAYSFALLNSGKRISGFSACPVAFGEISLKQRIKNVLSYRKPSFALCVVTILLVATVAVCFLTLPEPDTSVASVQAIEPETEPTETVQETTQETTEGPTEETAQPETQEPTEPVTTPPETTQPAPQPTTPATNPSVSTTPSTGSNTIVDTDQIDARITAYAASLGFQTLDSHPNGNVKSFSYTYHTGRHNLGSNDEKIMYAKGKALVESAYAHCEEIGSPIGQSIVWCRINYDASSGRYYMKVFCATVEAQ